MKWFDAVNSGNKVEVLKKLENYKKHVNYMFNGIYGCDELKVSLSPEEFTFAFENIVFAAIHNFDPEKLVYEDKEQATRSYLYKSIEGGIKTYICDINRVSHYYVDMLINIKRQDLDIWKEEDAESILSFLKKRFGTKNPDVVLARLQEEFFHAKPKNFRMRFGLPQMKNFIAADLKIKGTVVNDVVRLYYSAHKYDLWAAAGIEFAKELGACYPETKLRKLREQLDQDRVNTLFHYLDQCIVPSNPEFKVNNKKKEKVLTTDDVLREQIAACKSKMTRISSKISHSEEIRFNTKYGITKYYAEVLKNIYSRGMNPWRTDLIELAAAVSLVYPDLQKPCKFVQKLQAYDKSVINALFLEFSKGTAKTSVKSETKMKKKA